MRDYYIKHQQQDKEYEGETTEGPREDNSPNNNSPPQNTLLKRNVLYIKYFENI